MQFENIQHIISIACINSMDVSYIFLAKTDGFYDTFDSKFPFYHNTIVMP